VVQQNPVISRAAASASPTGELKEHKEYKIKKGDTLSKIAQEHDVEGGWRALWHYKDNYDVIGNNPNLIHPKDVIKVPTESVETAPGDRNGDGAGSGDGQYQKESVVSFSTDPGTIAQIYFPTGVSSLDESDRTTLKSLSGNISLNLPEFHENDNYETFYFDIVGYADQQTFEEESDISNLNLSRTRAMNVREEFKQLEGYRYISNSPVNRGAIHTAQGATGPKPASASKEGLAQYRRVDIKIVKMNGGNGGGSKDDEEDPEPERFREFRIGLISGGRRRRFRRRRLYVRVGRIGRRRAKQIYYLCRSGGWCWFAGWWVWPIDLDAFLHIRPYETGELRRSWKHGQRLHSARGGRWVGEPAI
jgi:flagellar motor protein MotB